MKFILKENSIQEINAEVKACLKMNPNEKTLIFFHYGTDALESHASVDDPTYIRQQKQFEKNGIVIKNVIKRKLPNSQYVFKITL
jgi:hypothetical protein